MKNLLALFFILFFIAGCASSSQPKSYINTSTPIFILKKPHDKKVYIDFKDLSQKENNVSAVIATKLLQNGYMAVEDKKDASIFIQGSIYYLKENIRRNTHGFVGVGFGFGSGKRRYRDVDFGISHRLYSNGGWNDFGSNGYRYDGQASLLIRIKNSDGFDNYSTNLNFLTEEDTYSINYARTLFNKQIADKILHYLKS